LFKNAILWKYNFTIACVRQGIYDGLNYFYYHISQLPLGFNILGLFSLGLVTTT